MIRLALVAIAALSLAGCASATAPAINCPPLASYTDLQKSVLLDEIDKDGPVTQAQIEDYAKLRKACTQAVR